MAWDWGAWPESGVGVAVGGCGCGLLVSGRGLKDVGVALDLVPSLSGGCGLREVGVASGLWAGPHGLWAGLWNLRGVLRVWAWPRGCGRGFGYWDAPGGCGRGLSSVGVA